MNKELRKRYTVECAAFGVDPDNPEDKGFDACNEGCISCGKTEIQMYKDCAEECGISVIVEEGVSVTDAPSKKADDEETMKKNMAEIANRGRRTKSPSVDDKATQTESTETEIEKESADNRTEGDISKDEAVEPPVVEPTDSAENTTDASVSNDQEEKIVVDAEAEDSSLDAKTVGSEKPKKKAAKNPKVSMVNEYAKIIKVAKGQTADEMVVLIQQTFPESKAVAQRFNLSKHLRFCLSLGVLTLKDKKYTWIGN